MVCCVDNALSIEVKVKEVNCRNNMKLADVLNIHQLNYICLLKLLKLLKVEYLCSRLL